MKHVVEVTEDGSHTLFVPELNEHYHSTHGAIQESRWVYIDAGLARCRKPSINILEVGFGTGLNAFLAMLEAERRGVPVFYTSIEKYPLPLAEVQMLNYAALAAPGMDGFFQALHRSPWNEPCRITPHFTLYKMAGDATDSSAYPHGIFHDVVFFDAFAPEKQPQMWTPDIFENLYAVSAKGGIVTTYCAKGEVRRMLQRAGFSVERLPGPPGKREMLRGEKP